MYSALLSSEDTKYDNVIWESNHELGRIYWETASEYQLKEGWKFLTRSWVLWIQLSSFWQTTWRKLPDFVRKAACNCLNVQSSPMIALGSEARCREKFDYMRPEVFNFHYCHKSLNRPMCSRLWSAQSQTHKYKFTQSKEEGRLSWIGLNRNETVHKGIHGFDRYVILHWYFLDKAASFTM